MKLEENIRQSLANLERNLEAIRSAREQVNAVVDKGQELNQGIRGIVTALDDFKNEVKTNLGSHISELQVTGKDVDVKLDVRIKELDKRIITLEEQSERLKENIDKLGVIDQTIEQTKTEITAAVTKGNQNLVKLEEQSTTESTYVRKAIEASELKSTELKELVRINFNQIGQLYDSNQKLQDKLNKMKTNSFIAMIILIFLLGLNLLILVMKWF